MTFKLSKVLVNIYFNSGFTHWAIQRFTGITLFAFLSLIFVVNSVVPFLLFPVFLISHLLAGIQTLMDDYIHDQVIFLVKVVCLRISALFLSKMFLLILLCF